MRFFLLLLTLNSLFSFNYRTSNHDYSYLFQPEKSFITTGSGGELGNGLFKSAMALSVALDNNYAFLVNSRYKNSYPQVFHKCKNFKLANPIKHTYLCGYLRLLRSNRKILPNSIIYGYPHSYLYFHHNREVICDLFNPSEKFFSNLKKKYFDILSNTEKYVGIHIRTFAREKDKVLLYWKKNSITYPRCSYEFYDKAINHFDKDSVFLVFSDNIQCAKRILQKYNRNFLYMDNSSLVEDFYMMSYLDKLIISNSTFSWWAAYLNPHIEKEIITPYPWYFQEKVETWEINGQYAICPPDWIEYPIGDSFTDGFDDVIRSYLRRR